MTDLVEGDGLLPHAMLTKSHNALTNVYPAET